jgi:hypothetical protein
MMRVVIPWFLLCCRVGVPHGRMADVVTGHKLA